MLSLNQAAVTMSLSSMLSSTAAFSSLRELTVVFEPRYRLFLLFSVPDAEVAVKESPSPLQAIVGAPT